MENLKYWAVWERYEHYDHMVDVFATKKAARECRNHLEAIERIENDERAMYVAPMTVFPDFDVSRYERVPEKVLFAWSECGRLKVEPSADWLNGKYTDKITVHPMFFTDAGLCNDYGFIFYLKYIPAFYNRDYCNKGMKKVRRLRNRFLDWKTLDLLEHGDPITLMEAGFKPNKDCEKWDNARRELRGAQFPHIYDAVIAMETYIGGPVVDYTFYKEINIGI